MRRASYGISVLAIGLLTACGSSSQESASSTTATPAASSTTAAPTTSTTKSASATSPATECDAAAISRDLNFTYIVERCYGNWAAIDNGGQYGDTQSLARLVDGKWTMYTSFPTGICLAQAKADGVPEREWGNFTTC